MPPSASRWPAVVGVIGAVFLVGGLLLYVRQISDSPSPASPAAAGAPVDLNERLPFDASIATGTLPNGLRYFVRANRQPERRAELRLVVNAGSVLEDDDQRGLAHFVEHMAFNGTERFPRHEIGAFMESIGMRFGPGVNATTGFDETVYRLQVPTDQPGALDRALTILEDWASRVTFNPVEIEKERPVVLEEWRLRRGARARIQDLQLPVLLQGSRYSDRLPIGTPESIRTFKPERLRQFYDDWYRPDLMAVVVVGDVDQAAVAARVQSQFGAVRARADKRPRPVVPVPHQPGTRFVIAADREATSTSVSISYRVTPVGVATVGDYRASAVERLAAGMMSLRLAEVAQTPNGPLLAAGLNRTGIVRSADVVSLSATVRDGAAEAGLGILAAERARLVKFGFIDSELERQKTTMLRGYERAIAEKGRQASAALADEYTRHFTTGEPVPGLEWEFDAMSRVLPGIALADVNAVAGRWFPEDTRIVTVSLPDRAGRARPSEASLTKALAAAASAALTPWVARVTATSLLDEEPVPGSIAATVTHAAIGVTEWTLSNGVRVVLLPTTFKEDQIVFSAVSPGGLSLAGDADLVPAQTAGQVVNSMGFGRFGSGDLRRWLAGRAVSVQPVIGPFEEGLSGGSSRQDLETMFELIHLMMTSPRRDPVIFQAVRAQMLEAVANQVRSPDVAFGQALADVLSQSHPRARPLTADALARMDMERSLAFYKDRFGDASDFTFVFAGSFDLNVMRPLVERYLASLPATRRGERWKDPGVRPPKGVVTRVVERGVEPKARTALVFTGPAEPDRLRAVTIVALAEVLQSRLRDALREELGGTYNVNVAGNLARVPAGQFTISIDFTSDPARADALADRVLSEIAKLRQTGPTARQVNDVQAAFLRDFETNRQQNPFLVGQLAQRYQSGEPPDSVWQMPGIYKALTPAMIRDAAVTCLDARNYVRVTLRPEK